MHSSSKGHKKWHNRLGVLLLLIVLYYLVCWYKTDYISSELPEAILVGVKKSGTGALQRFLNTHPDISFTDREIKFFNHPWKLMLGYRWYVNQFPPRKHAKGIRMEKTVQYFHFPSITRMLWSMNRNLKILIVVREPTVRTVSDHTHEVVNKKYGGSFEQKLLDRFGEVNPESDLLSPSLYAKHLQRFLQYFPRDNIHIIDGDTLIKQNPFIQLSKIEEFLNISPHFNQSQFIFEPRKGFYCMNKNGRPKCLEDGKGRVHVQVNEDTKNKLRKFLVKPNEEFYRISGRNFTWNNWL